MVAAYASLFWLWFWVRSKMQIEIQLETKLATSLKGNQCCCMCIPKRHSKAQEIIEIIEKYEIYCHPILVWLLETLWISTFFLCQICISQAQHPWPSGGSKILPTDASWDAAAPWGHRHDLIFLESWCGNLQNHWGLPTSDPQNRLKSRNL